MTWKLPIGAVRGIALAALLAPVPVPAQDPDPTAGDVNLLDLAGLLIRDGHYDRAEQVLGQVDPESDDMDRGRFHLLQGLVALNRDRAPAAEGHFLRAIGEGQDDPVIYVYLARAHFRQGNFAETLGSLERSGGAGSHLPAVHLMAARAYWELKDPASALAVLDRAHERFVDIAPFVRQKLFQLINMGLYREAAGLGLEYLAGRAGSADDYIAIGNALRESGELDAALAFLESARLRYPDDGRVMKVLAHAWLDRGSALNAAEIMTAAALHDPELNVEAAELQRRAGNLYRALALNSEVPDQKKKLKQRLAILLELQRYGQVSGMADDLYRVGLLDDQDVSYALAFALFQSGQFDAAERRLSGISRGDLFRKAVELREAMKQCRDEPWQCY